MERDLFREELDELAPHIEDDLRTGAFEMEKITVTSEQYAGLVIETTKGIVAEEKANGEYAGLGHAYHEAKEIVAEFYTVEE